MTRRTDSHQSYSRFSGRRLVSTLVCLNAFPNITLLDSVHTSQKYNVSFLLPCVSSPLLNYCGCYSNVNENIIFTTVYDTPYIHVQTNTEHKDTRSNELNSHPYTCQRHPQHRRQRRHQHRHRRRHPCRRPRQHQGADRGPTRGMGTPCPRATPPALRGLCWCRDRGGAYRRFGRSSGGLQKEMKGSGGR